ncbi:MAG: class Ib ribonucleoside-diphosphate reductase assembly flavoprotein NrdI [Mycobacteriaceae bacterium]
MKRDGGLAEGAPVRVVYFSSVSENTHRFVEKLGMPAIRIPLREAIEVDGPYVLILPTYGGGRAEGPDPEAGSYVPKQVIAFLNNEHNRLLLRGVIAAGNTNFGAEFCYAGDVVSRKCNVPFLYRFELMGTVDDVEAVRAGLNDFWKSASFQEGEDTCHQRSQLQSR